MAYVVGRGDVSTRVARYVAGSRRVTVPDSTRLSSAEATELHPSWSSANCGPELATPSIELVLPILDRPCNGRSGMLVSCAGLWRPELSALVSQVEPKFPWAPGSFGARSR